MTTSDKAVRKASRDRLLRDFARAAVMVRAFRWRAAEQMLAVAAHETSRTRYACLMTAFGQ